VDRETVRQWWLAWAQDAIGGEPDRQAYAVEAALNAIAAGADSDGAARVAQQAAAGWPGGANQISPVTSGLPGGVAVAPKIWYRSPWAIAGGIVVALVLVIAGLLIAVAAGAFEPAEAKESADAIIRDASADMRAWSSYHGIGVTRDGGRQEIEYQVLPQSYRGLIKRGNSELQILAVGDKRYLAGNATFLAGDPVLAQNAANVWIEVGSSPETDPNLFTPTTGADCVLGKHGTLTKRGLRSVQGRQAIEIDDAGDKPGSTAARFFVAVDDRPNLLRVESISHTLAGTVDNRCVNGFGIQAPPGMPLVNLDLVEIGKDFSLQEPSQPLDLNNPPFCGAPISGTLSEAAKQYLLAAFERSKLLLQAERDCGCPTPTNATLRVAYKEMADAEANFIPRLQQLPVTPQQHSKLQAYLGLLQQVLARDRSALTYANNNHFVPSYDDTLIARTASAGDALRVALGLIPSPCGYSLPRE